MQQVAQGTQHVNGNIAAVMQAAGDTGAASEKVLRAAVDLSEQATRLNAEVAAFLAKARAV